MPVFDLKINGREVKVETEADTPLLWVLRGELKMTGTKYGCGIGSCRACAVHLNGNPVASCMVPVSDIGKQEVSTIEGVAGKEIDALRNAWNDVDVVQCGYCQSGQLMSACALLKKHPKPSDEDIDTGMNGNICRCGTYPRIRAAIHKAAEALA